jgi:hypothetical protein
MPTRTWPLALVLFLAACGTDEKKPATGATDPRAYYGLQTCRCMVYRNGGSEDFLGVADESTTTSVKPGTTLDWVRYYLHGTAVRQEAQLATPEQLQLWSVRNSVGTWRMAANALPFVKFPPDQQTVNPQIFTGDAFFQAAGGSEMPFQITSRGDYAPPSAQDYRLDSVNTKSSNGQRISYTLQSSEATIVPWDEHARVFVPNVGFTSLELDADGTGLKHWDLDSVQTIRGGCPFTLDANPPQDQICGFSLR